MPGRGFLKRCNLDRSLIELSFGRLLSLSVSDLFHNDLQIFLASWHYKLTHLISTHQELKVINYGIT